ncbi:MAG: outer membrane protein assembly factor BamD [Gemmatimonadota bacterium]|nr:outer membrane protein assembly factor BamD [Gemmatimonadota bacterium]
MSFLRRSRVGAVAALALVAGCHHKGGFQPLKYPSHQALYDASLAELHKHKWGHAVAGFEKLTTDLPARDPLLPESYFYLGDAHMGSKEYILAAQSYSRVAENFPEDTLADRATYKTGIAYSKLWRRPGLDPEYGETSRSTFQSFLAAYPDSPLRDSAVKQIERLDEWFATKGYNNGVTYYKRKAYDSGIIYFRDVVKQYPKTDAARKSQIRLVQSYRAIKYKEDASETCGQLEKAHPSDKDVIKVCRGVKPTLADTTAGPRKAPAPAAPLPNPPAPIDQTSGTPSRTQVPAPVPTPPSKTSPRN